MCIDYKTVFFVYRRSSYPVYLKFKINKFELQMLCMLSAFLLHRGKNIVSKAEFFDTMTNNSRERIKIEGYLHGCIDKKFVGCYEYISHPGSLSVGLSDLGISVIKSFEEDLKKMVDKYQPTKDFSSLSISNGIGRYIPIAA